MNIKHTDERRKDQRSDYLSQSLLQFSVADELGLTLSAKIVDISAGGIGIISEKDLQPGQTLNFEPHPHINLPNSGIVIWTVTGIEGIRSGIHFNKD